MVFDTGSAVDWTRAESSDGRVEAIAAGEPALCLSKEGSWVNWVTGSGSGVDGLETGRGTGDRSRNLALYKFVGVLQGKPALRISSVTRLAAQAAL
jgi:hypothetical protein